jgi:hypothetical protein
MKIKEWIMVRSEGQTNPTLIPKNQIRFIKPCKGNELLSDIYLIDLNTILTVNIPSSEIEKQL